MIGKSSSLSEVPRVTKSERICDLLRALRLSTPEILGATVVSSEGFIVASVLPNEVDEDVIAGMVASLLGIGERIASDLLNAQMEQVYVRAAKGYVVVNACGPDAALVLLVTREAKLGLIFLELKRTVADLARLL